LFLLSSSPSPIPAQKKEREAAEPMPPLPAKTVTISVHVRDDTQALADIVARSQGAEGSLQAAQATNQLLALTAKQQFQLQQMMAAQFRSESQEQARRATQALEARAATRKFLGSGSAYTPQ